jgi:DNA-directed RNA polymerase specialized sigma24 family protein
MSDFRFFAGCDAFLDGTVSNSEVFAMNKEGEDSPDSSDLAGWRRAVEEGRLGSLRPETLLCAVQDLGPDADPRVLNPIAKRLSEIIMRMVRKYVGTNKPNRGEDIIQRVHEGIWITLLDEESEERRTLRDGLGGIVKFRCLDAIALENKHSRIPLEPKLREGKRNEDPAKVPMDRTRAAEVSHLVAPQDPKHPGATGDGFSGNDAVSARKPADPAQFQEMQHLEAHVDIERVLACITDDRKRLAFCLFLEDFPYGSKKTASIAEAVGISSKTAEHWIEELIALLQQTEEAKELINKKVGEGS